MKWIGTTALILGASSSSSAAAKDQFSWGKAGVSLLQYRADAIECGRLGASHDIRDAEPTARFLRTAAGSERSARSDDGRLPVDPAPIPAAAAGGRRSGDAGFHHRTVPQRSRLPPVQVDEGSGQGVEPAAQGQPIAPPLPAFARERSGDSGEPSSLERRTARRRFGRR